MNWPPRKLTFTLIAFAILMLATDYVPPLKNFKVMDWDIVSTLPEFVDRHRSTEPEIEEKLRLRPESDPLKQTAFPIVDPHHNLDSFYKQLHQSANPNGGAITRILHYGDSPTTADMITSDTRRLLQKQFGDAGHGFCLIAKPWEWYAHDGIEMRASGWTIDTVNQPSIKDGLFGLGGVSFRGEAGSEARFRIKRIHKWVELSFLRQPNGGQVRVFAGSTDLGIVTTDGPKPASDFQRFELPDSASEVTIRVMSGPVRLYGIHLENERSGVIYESLGVNGAYVSVLARMIDEKHWREQLQHFQPHLVIINYGTNESMYPPFVDNMSEKELRETIRRVRVALPQASILVMSPMDRGQRMQEGNIGTAPAIERVVSIQARVATNTETAFFNTFEAMGGNGTMGRWYAAEPRLVGADFIHPMPAGARIVGGLLYQALLDGYNKYKLRLLRNKTMVATN